MGTNRVLGTTLVLLRGRMGGGGLFRERRGGGGGGGGGLFRGHHGPESLKRKTVFFVGIPRDINTAFLINYFDTISKSILSQC